MRTQTGVHLENKPFLSVSSEGLDDLLSLFGQRLSVCRLIADEKKVGIRQLIEFPAAEPSERQHCEPGWASCNLKGSADGGFSGRCGFGKRRIHGAAFREISRSRRKHAVTKTLTEQSHFLSQRSG